MDIELLALRGVWTTNLTAFLIGFGIVFAVFLLGFGIGMSFASMANLIVEAVPQHQTGEATGMNTIMRTIGGAFGAQIAAAIVADHVAAGHRYATEAGFTDAFILSAVALVVAFGAAALIPGRRSAAGVREHELVDDVRVLGAAE